MNIFNPSYETEKIVSFIRDVLQQTKKTKVVLGWSGGIDSTVSLYLLARALDPKQIHLLHMPYTKSFMDEFDQIIAKEIQIPTNNIHEISIKKAVDTISYGVSIDDKSQESKARKGNIMARVRMIILFDYAKKIDALVCGTENRSEHILGYFTRFGDEASDFEPIQHLFKTQVYELAKYIGAPQVFIDKTPSANLWAGQTDEDEFGFLYKDADQVLENLDGSQTQTQKLPGFGTSLVQSVQKRVASNAFKHKTPYSLSTNH